MNLLLFTFESCSQTDLETSLLCIKKDDVRRMLYYLWRTWHKSQLMQRCQTLCEAAEIRQHQRVLAQEATENGLPNEMKYHRECRSTFTHKKKLHRIAKDPEKPVEENPRRLSRRNGIGSSSVILPSYCIFRTYQSSDILQHSQNRPTGDRWLKL